MRICDELHRDQFLRPHRNYHFTRTKQELIQQSTSTSNQSYSHSKDRIFNQKKIIMKKSSSLLLHLHLHLLHFLIMNKSSYLKKKKEIFKKGLETRGIGLIFLRPLSKKKKKKFHQSNFLKFLQKLNISKFFKKKISKF